MDEEYLLIGFFIVVAIIAAFKRNGFVSGNHTETTRKTTFDELEEAKRNQELEDEMDAYALEEHEKELVRKEEYNVWDFDTEDADEDDDYYNDDV